MARRRLDGMVMEDVNCHKVRRFLFWTRSLREESLATSTVGSIANWEWEWAKQTKSAKLQPQS